MARGETKGPETPLRFKRNLHRAIGACLGLLSDAAPAVVVNGFPAAGKGTATSNPQKQAHQLLASSFAAAAAEVAKGGDEAKGTDTGEPHQEDTATHEPLASGSVGAPSDATKESGAGDGPATPEPQQKAATRPPLVGGCTAASAAVVDGGDEAEGPATGAPQGDVAAHPPLAPASTDGPQLLTGAADVVICTNDGEEKPPQTRPQEAGSKGVVAAETTMQAKKSLGAWQHETRATQTDPWGLWDEEEALEPSVRSELTARWYVADAERVSLRVDLDAAREQQAALQAELRRLQSQLHTAAQQHKSTQAELSLTQAALARVLQRAEQEQTALRWEVKTMKRERDGWVQAARQREVLMRDWGL